MTIDAFTIAEWFIAHNNQVVKYNSAEKISNLKVQKLLYYAQGCALASLGRPLFSEDILAWKHGPVVEQVYRKYQKYGSDGIAENPCIPNVGIEIEMLLINTYNSFAKYSAWELANHTHTEEPWRFTQANQIIPLILIKNYFVNHYANINVPNDLTENIGLLRSFEQYPENWDGEDAVAYDSAFIQDAVDLVSTLQVQPDIGPTGRGSIDLVYGSVKDGEKYLDLEIFQDDRHVHVVSKDSIGIITKEDITMEDVNGRVKQF